MVNKVTGNDTAPVKGSAVEQPKTTAAKAQTEISNDAVAIKLTDRTVYVQLKRVADVARPILVRLGVFSDTEKSLNKEIELAQKVAAIDYPAKQIVNLPATNKGLYNLKLALANKDVSSEDSKNIVVKYATTGEIDVEGLDIKAEDFQAAVNAKPTMRQLLAELVSKGNLGAKTAAVLDTAYRVAAKLLAAGVVLATISATVAAVGITLPVSAAIIIVAITAIAVTTIVLTEGIENYEAAKDITVSKPAVEEKTQQVEAGEIDIIDETAALLASERLKAFFVSATALLTQISEATEEGGVFDKFYEAVQTDLVDPFKMVSKGASTAAATT